ncbi:hypothetical protein KTT_22940 [Tengunoibacter tsumagoiensis]|uniref:Uncharacterized protein n=1 Tax=Tengunoibacter tsumagoiensis TaxID=2014871 RepID=A0A402A008_9CHLR|nr:hypothetical protein KTT_22940 [Tengunoibacter tsumagoiensis]
MNTHHFEDVAPLIAEQAVYWFNEGAHLREMRGKKQNDKYPLPYCQCPNT